MFHSLIREGGQYESLDAIGLIEGTISDNHLCKSCRPDYLYFLSEKVCVRRSDLLQILPYMTELCIAPWRSLLEYIPRDPFTNLV